MAKSADSRLQRKKHHRSNQNSSSQISSLPYASHGECLMVEGMKKKKSKKIESKDEEEDEEENDLDFDKLSKKDMIKIKNIFKRL
jgi:hypothetical protein